MNREKRNPPTAPQAESIRLFRNPLLEAMTHVHPPMPALIWLPVAIWLFYRTIASHQISASGWLQLAIAGLLTWTFAEYAIHRFVFHYPAKSALGKRLVFLFHGVHHDVPNDKTRLLMPPVGAALILAVLWGLFSLLLPQPLREPFMAFFILGYLIYDYIHYATHHLPMRHPVLRYLKRFHMAHHFFDPSTCYGISSPLWDKVFGTSPQQYLSRQARTLDERDEP